MESTHKISIYRTIWLIFVLMLMNQNITYAQVDTTQNPEVLRKNNAAERKARKKARRQKFLSKLPKNHNPKTATLLALIPGAGQIYNHRYWKLPIVYGGLGALGYFTVTNYVEFSCFRRAYLSKVDEDPNTNYTCSLADTSASAATLKLYRNNARSNSETFLLLTILFYGLTITDAFVDAHLMHFDIDDDLSLHVSPQLDYDFRHRSWVPSVGLTVVRRTPTKTPYPVQF